ncbi:hypothetical protein GFL09_02755 [Pseudomonas stutzeri]|uniref:polymer-forming cytoskeletal protein n=1 Tax=Stutzerimonas stutzeri TaxID=316 RepID=UPI001909CCC3|nr:polymer-forming cytoskeletal protein [Stutzerimonas stutzeri]MBK3866619.1 hypothetical protein [Stutzerimonas stutzeri]
MNCYQRVGIWLGLIVLLICQVANAATYNISQGQLPTCNNWNNSWSVNGTTYTCSSSVNLLAGDKYVANGPVTLRAEAGITLSSNEIGSAESPISLQTSYGALNASNGNSVIYGNLHTESGALILAGVSLTGNVQSAGVVTIERTTLIGTINGSRNGNIADSSISGAVNFENGLAATNTIFSSTLTSGNGAVTLSGGSVAGLVSVTCCKVTVSGGATISNGILAGSNGIDISNSTVSGALKAGNNPINLTNVTMISGSINAGSNNITISGGSLTADISDANNVYIRSGASVTGDVQARYRVNLNSSTVQGSITGSSGYALQNVDLRNSSVNGDVTVGTSWQTITGDDSSRIYGVCTYKTVNPKSLCEAGEVSGAHHYRLDYSPTALTCGSLSVAIRACADAACTSTISVPSTLTLNPSGGWAANPLTFTGSTTATLVVRSPGEVALGVSSASPAASNGLMCSTSGCKVAFLDSGFLVSVPNMISSRPQSASIAAVRKDDASQACVPAFANVSRTLNFSTSYQNPSTGTRSITVNGSSSAAPLSFNGNGVASVTVNYDDAGQVALNVSYSGSNSDQGLSMTGSGSFIAKPYGLCITPDNTPPTCTVAGVSSNCTVLAAAGDPFPIRVKAVGWQGTTINGVQTGEALSGEALCTGNVVTPNFQLSNIGLSLSLVEPSAGISGSSTLPSSYTHARGEQTSLNGSGGVSFSEVGVFRIAAKTNTEYMGMGHVGGDGTTSGSNANNQNLSRLIGRIVPAYLDVTPNTPLLQPNCVTDSETMAGFSYQGEAISFAVAPMLTVTGKNRANGTTTNYDRGEFWRWQSSDFTHSPEFGSDDDGIHDGTRLKGNPGFTVETNNPELGDGAREVTIRGQTLTYERNLYVPLPNDAAFRPYLALRFPMTDQDGVCYKSGDTSAAGACKPYLLDNFSFSNAGSQIRLGRAVLENANGSELAPLDLPLVIESWEGSYFARTSDDSCTVVSGEPKPELSDYSGHLNAGETEASMESMGTHRFVELTKPGLGNEGSVWVMPTVPELLRYDWNGSGSFQNPRGLATFGIYKGPQPLIFRREVYR